MKSKKLNIYIRIIAMFAVLMLTSFLAENIPDLLGDWTCKGSGKYIIDGEYSDHWSGCNYAPFSNGNGYHAPEQHYGFRHYLLIMLGFVLFVFQCIDLGLYIDGQRKAE